MPEIKILVTNKKATVEGAPVIICGNSDYVLKLTLDAEWGAVQYKTARFVYVQNGQVLHEDVDFTGSDVKVPALFNTSQVKVGVFAGELYTSTPAVIPCKSSILCGCGEPANPTPEEDARIMALLNLAIEQQAEAEAAADRAENALATHAPAIVVEKTGDSLVLTDSAAAPLRGLRVFGKSTQKTYEGNQLLNVNDVKSTLYGTIDDEGYVTFEYDNTNGTSSVYPRLIINTSELLQPNTQYMLVTEIVELSNVHMLAMISTSSISQFKETIQIGVGLSTGTRVDVVTTLDNFEECDCMLRCGATIVAGASGKIKFRISLIEDTTVTADTFIYEPFVGGEQSPSINYPQEVVPHGKGGSIEHTLLGRNFFNGVLTKGGISGTTGAEANAYDRFRTDFIKVAPNMSYVWTEYINPPKSFYPRFYDKDKTFLPNATFTILNSLPFTIPSDAHYIRLMYTDTSYVDLESIDYEAMFNIGTESLPYEEYVEPQEVTWQTPNGLPGVPVTDASLATYTDAAGQMWVADEVDLERGVYVQRTVVYVLNSASIVKAWTNDSGDIIGVLISGLPYYNAASSKVFGFSSHFSLRLNGSLEPNTLGVRMMGDDYRFYIANTDSLTSVEEWGAYFDGQIQAGTPVKVQLIAAEPVETPLTAEELKAYKDLHTNYPNTTILGEAHTEVKYVADTKTYIDNKIAEVCAAMLNS